MRIERRSNRIFLKILPFRFSVAMKNNPKKLAENSLTIR